MLSPRRVAFVSLVLTASHARALAADETPIADRYRETAGRIADHVRAGHDGYRKLQELCDDIGCRLSGSPQLDRAVRWAADTLRRDGHENVRLEPVKVPQWVRGRESCTVRQPREVPLRMLGLGYSIGTPPGGITAPIIVVRDESELDAVGAEARGKIVLFNNAMQAYSVEGGTGYGAAVRFRSDGARLAAERGAVACLIRSVTAHSLRSAHTGMMKYDGANERIPAAALAVEDAELIARWQARGIPVTVTLQMEAENRGDVESANVVAELRGAAFPEEIVVIGGHIDSWDVGQGAHDDGGGVVMAMEALNVLRKLDLRPRRTIRVVLWTAEEVGLLGGKAYAVEHAAELDRHVAAIEADIGCFSPIGYSVDCADEARLARASAQMRDVLSLFKALGANQVRPGGSAPDVSPMKPAGVMVMGHETDPAHYFDYHHSEGDTLDKIEPRDLADNIIVMATVAYVLADMPERIGAALEPLP